MKKFHWDDCKYSFRGFNTLEHIIWYHYRAKQLITEIESPPKSFTEDSEFIAGLYDHFQREVDSACNEATVKGIIGTAKPSKEIIQKTRLEVAIRVAARNFYNKYEELFTQNPKKNIAQLISYIPYWDSFDARDMEPRRYKNLADCIAHTYTGGDLIASQRWDNDGERAEDFIMEGLDAHILYSHYKNEFKRYATRKNLEVPRDCDADEDWIKFTNGLFAETVTRVYLKYRKAIIKAPTVSAARALKIYKNSRNGGR